MQVLAFTAPGSELLRAHAAKVAELSEAIAEARIGFNTARAESLERELDALQERSDTEMREELRKELSSVRRLSLALG